MTQRYKTANTSSWWPATFTFGRFSSASQRRRSKRRAEDPEVLSARQGLFAPGARASAVQPAHSAQLPHAGLHHETSRVTVRCTSFDQVTPSVEYESVYFSVVHLLPYHSVSRGNW